ncbi:MAG: alginate export family protein [Flavobacteriales bacterium]
MLRLNIISSFCCIVAFSFYCANSIVAQDTAIFKEFNIDLEFRPRAEYRDGYKQLKNDTTSPSYFVNQRTRLNITYQTEKFIFHTSLQDIRLYGQSGQFSSNVSIGVFETYVESFLSKIISLRIGRQKLDLDNNRLFSPANWSQQSRAHEGIRLIYKKECLLSELMGAFSQSNENIFNTNYSPVGFNNYKILGVHHLKWTANEKITLTTINATDGFEHKTNAKVLYLRTTSGGRIEYKTTNFYVTISGYYQYGSTPNGAKLSAFYIQPEIKYNASEKLTTWLGAEILSGDDATKKSNISNSFEPLYGVAHRFMGSMDYFTSFPKDVKNGGLINPYLFIQYAFNKKFSIKNDAHLFYTQNNVLNKNNNVINPFLAFENDISIKYRFNELITLDGGVAFMLAEKSMETIKGGSSTSTPTWAFVMITFKPELFRYKSKH